MVPSVHVRELARIIPGAAYAELESGHLAPLEKPSELLDLLESFLLRETVG